MLVRVFVLTRTRLLSSPLHMAQKTLDSFVISPKKGKRPASQDAAAASPKRARTEGVETAAVTPEQADDGNGEQGKQTSVVA